MIDLNVTRYAFYTRYRAWFCLAYTTKTDFYPDFEWVIAYQSLANTTFSIVIIRRPPTSKQLFAKSSLLE